MKSLDEICNVLGADKGTVWHGYAPLYDSLFSKWRDEPIRLLEMGTQAFCSVNAWLEYFTKAEIVGMDVWKGSPFPENYRFKLFLGDQSNVEFLTQLKKEAGPFHIIVDDAGHYPLQIKVAFEHLWPHLVLGGLYCIEDTHSFFHPDWTQNGAGQEFVKELFGALNWCGKQFHGDPTPKPYTLTYLESTLERITMIKGLVVLHKRAEPAT